MFNGDGARGILPRRRTACFGSFIVDRRGTVLGFDEGMEKLTGWPAAALVGRRGRVVIHDPASGWASQEPSMDPDVRLRTVALRLTCRDRSAIDVEALATRLPGRGERTLITVLRVLARFGAAGAPDAIEGLDRLTSLANRETFRRVLDDAVSGAARHGRPVSLIHLDVDHFRRINDQFGRNHGDRVLKTLAGVLRASTEAADRIARLGEDDFAILLSGAGRGEARQTAARLRSTVERFDFIETSAHRGVGRVTLSLGAASFPTDADSADDLLKRGREALDEARALGRNRVWCYTRRPRVPLEVPVFFDGPEELLVGFTRDLSPSGLFVQTSAPVEVGMRCALCFPLPEHEGRVHVIGRVVRTVPPAVEVDVAVRVPGMGIEFERFGSEDRQVIEAYLYCQQASVAPPRSVLA